MNIILIISLFLVTACTDIKCSDIPKLNSSLEEVGYCVLETEICKDIKNCPKEYSEEDYVKLNDCLKKLNSCNKKN